MTVDATSQHAATRISAQLGARLATALTEAAAGRERQLEELPSEPGDLVAAAHRDSVVRILAEIRAAQARLEAGTLGCCARCGDRIPAARLELRPWTTLCVGCGRLVRP